MKIRNGVRAGLAAGLVALFAIGSRAEGPPPDRAATRLSDSQLTLRRGRVQGRATVVALAGRRLTVVTAAHFLGPDDAGRSILIGPAEAALGGRIVEVRSNPGYRPSRSKTTHEPSTYGTVGVDTAVAVLEADPRTVAGRQLLKGLRPAALATEAIPGGPGWILTVHVVDQLGEEHVVRAGNHLNPKCLAWGRRGYQARPGDSGAGVFVVRPSARGEPRPLLIGNVSQVDERGTIASLFHSRDAWLAGAIPRSPLTAGPPPRGDARSTASPGPDPPAD